MIGEMIVIEKRADRRQLWMKFCQVGGWVDDEEV